jgi:hypothetical protein
VAVIVADFPVAINEGGLEVKVMVTGSSQEPQPFTFSQINGCHPVIPEPDVRSPPHVSAKQILENTRAVNEIAIVVNLFLGHIFQYL